MFGELGIGIVLERELLDAVMEQFDGLAVGEAEGIDIGFDFAEDLVCVVEGNAEDLQSRVATVEDDRGTALLELTFASAAIGHKYSERLGWGELVARLDDGREHVVLLGENEI